MLPPTILKHWPEFIPIDMPLQIIFDNYSPLPKEKACGTKINHIHWVEKLDQENLDYHNQSIDIEVQTSTIPSEHIPELSEIDVFLIDLNRKSIPQELLCLLDKHMDKFLLFVCSYQNHYCLVANYKKAQANNSNHVGFEITQTLSSAWLAADKLQIPLKGQNLREAYLYILEYIYTNQSKEPAPLSLDTISAPTAATATATENLPTPQSPHSQAPLAETVSIEQVLEAKAQLSALDAQLQKCKQKQAKENQPNKKLALHKQAQKLKKKILELSQLIQKHTTHT